MTVLQLPADEETVPEPSPGPQETHPTGGRRITGNTTISGEDPDQVPLGTSSAPVRGSGWPGPVNQNDEDMSELVPVLLAQGKNYKKEMESLVEDTKAWIFVSLEKSRLLQSSVPDRILQPRLVLTLQTEE